MSTKPGEAQAEQSLCGLCGLCVRPTKAGNDGSGLRRLRVLRVTRTASFAHENDAVTTPRTAPAPLDRPAPRRMADLERLARLLDEAIRVPGTNVRFGLDALIGLVPGVGDLAGAALAGYIVLAGVRRGAPASVLLRMLLNVGIDTVVGSVPVVGDLFDVGWRANSRNVALLERHATDPQGARAASAGVVIAVVVGLAVLLGIAVAAAWLVLRGLGHLVATR